MSRRKVLYAVVVVLSLLVAAAGVYRQVDARRDQHAAASSRPTQRALVPAPLTVSLTALSQRRIAAVGSATYLAVNAAGTKITQVRLYDGAALVGVQTFRPAKVDRASVRFAWPAVREGNHVLHAVAVGAKATEVGHSAPLRLRAVAAAVPVTTVTLPGNGRTPDQIAAATGVQAGALRYRSAAGKTVGAPASGRPLAAGVVATVRLDQVTPQAPAPAKDTAAPTALEVTLDGCRATVSSTGTSSAPVSVYEMTGGGAGFTVRGTASAGSPYVSDELTPGSHVFVAGPRDGPADSAPVAIEVPDTCLAQAWSGKATLFDGELTLPAPEPRIWVYLGVDGEPFRRIPAQGTVSAAFGTADLADLMPTLNGSHLRMEVWRAGATAASPATRVARSEATVADATALADLIGGAPVVELVGQADAVTANPLTMTAKTAEVKFTWQTTSQLPDGVVWQVLGRPLSAADRNTAPPVLLATGFSENGSGGGINLTGDKGGSFTLPAEVLLAGRPTSGPLGAVLRQVPTPAIAQLVAPGSSFAATPLKAPTGASVPTLDAGIVPVPIGDVYVRVLPVTGVSVIGDASNTVAVTLPPLDPTKATFKATKITLDPGRGANSALGNCVRITGTPPAGSSFGSIYRSDRTWCPSDFDSPKGGGCSGWCQIVEDVGSLVSFVGQVWDYLATAYNTVVDTLVTVIAKFNPFCLTASVAGALSDSPYADGAAQGCEAVASVVASVVVSVVLSSFGLPARLPTSKQLADVAEGDLTGLAVAYLETLGVPCAEMTVDADVVAGGDAAGVEVPAGAKNAQGDVDVCAAMVQQAVGAIREQVKQAAQAEVSNTTGLPVPPAPQEMVLEPRGRYQGATVTVVATPLDPNTAKTARCGISALGNVRDWAVGNYGAFEPRDIQPGYGTVAYNPASAFGVGAPWGATVQLRPIQDLVESETISVSLTSPCFVGALSGPLSNVKLREPLGYWHPGEPE